MRLANGKLILSIPKVILTRDQDELWDNWIYALKSGTYHQAANSLKTEDGYCCLGVACDLVDKRAWTEVFHTGTILPSTFNYAGEEDVLPTYMKDKYGLPISSGFEIIVEKDGGAFVGDVAFLNDDGATFQELAQVLEYARADGYRNEEFYNANPQLKDVPPEEIIFQ